MIVVLFLFVGDVFILFFWVVFLCLCTFFAYSFLVRGCFKEMSLSHRPRWRSLEAAGLEEKKGSDLGTFLAVFPCVFFCFVFFNVYVFVCIFCFLKDVFFAARWVFQCFSFQDVKRTQEIGRVTC